MKRNRSPNGNGKRKWKPEREQLWATLGRRWPTLGDHGHWLWPLAMDMAGYGRPLAEMIEYYVNFFITAQQ